MIAAQQVDQLTKVDRALIRTLLYFDIFEYPLTYEELIRFAPEIYSDFPSALNELISAKIIFRLGEYYSVKNDFRLASRRIEGNQLAAKKMKTAQRFSKIISAFPFVRAVMLSGSISKGFMDKNSDIDFFIITETKRLWIVRTALALFRRIFLFNSHKNLCTNYFVDVQNLPIPEQNIFTATELITLKPMYGNEVIEKFLTANKWVYSFLPQSNFDLSVNDDKKSIVKNALELTFSILNLNNLNEWLMKKTFMFWRRKYSKNISDSDFEVAFRTKEGVSKSHPQFFQKKVLSSLDEKISSFEFENRIDLSR